MQQKSNELYSAIVATVGATIERRLTVSEIAIRIGTSAEIAAHCIAFHRYVRLHADRTGTDASIESPLPSDFPIPGIEDLIDEEGLGLTPPAALTR